MTIDVVGLGGIAAAILAICALYKLVKKYFIGRIMDELSVIFECFMAVFDGLEQQGCNGAVTKAKEKLTRRLNEQAHK